MCSKFITEMCGLNNVIESHESNNDVKMHPWVKLTQKNWSQSVAKNNPDHAVWPDESTQTKPFGLLKSNLASLGKIFIDVVTGGQGQYHPACIGHWKPEITAKIQNPTFQPSNVLAPSGKHYVFKGWTTTCTYIYRGEEITCAAILYCTYFLTVHNLQDESPSISSRKFLKNIMVCFSFILNLPSLNNIVLKNTITKAVCS